MTIKGSYTWRIGRCVRDVRPIELGVVEQDGDGVREGEGEWEEDRRHDGVDVELRQGHFDLCKRNVFSSI